MPLWQVTVGGGGNAPPSEILREMLRGLQAAPNFFSSARGDQTQNIGRLGLTAGGLGRPWRSMLLRGWGRNRRELCPRCSFSMRRATLCV